MGPLHDGGEGVTRAEIKKSKHAPHDKIDNDIEAFGIVQLT